MVAVGGMLLGLDREIRWEDVQSLSSRDEVAALFAALGYHTDARLTQSPANLGITADWLVRQIAHIERLADQEGLLQVYLIELSSVTLAATRGIASALRNRAGNYLLVLTHDYERIDFVLVEKIAPRAEAGQTIGQKQVSVRPRILTVGRRNPTKVDLRVLRRLSYTEPDPIAQYDKLKSAFDIADWSEAHFNNRALFADYYLRERMPDLPEWAENPVPAFRQFRQLYERSASRWAGKSEFELRTGLLEPALRLLEFDLGIVKSAGDDRPEPDYRLRNSAGDVVGVCLAYRWNRFLDGKDESRDAETPDENPGAVVVSLLERGEAPFAIVTNGKHWRLYAAQTHSRATNYYEIDLEETLALDDPNEAFRYFWLLFRRQALEPREAVVDGESMRATFIELLLRQSEQYSKRLGERLKDRVFEEIFPQFAEGFIACMRANPVGAGPRACPGQPRGVAPTADMTQSDLDTVFHGTLTFLYRLLFLLYAEARDLLPAREVRGYFDASLKKLKQDVANAAGDVGDECPGRIRKLYSAGTYALYDRLTALFRIVDRGDAGRNVPVYNGGLFLTDVQPEDSSPEAENARFLLAHKIPDRYLALGLDLLARDDDEKTFKRVFIDYKSLGVRQLGSIYEGLLEFRLRIASEKMAICKGKKTEEVAPYAEAHERHLKILTAGKGKDAAERTLPKGAVYLENDKRERKATGSYYTPDYIVQYIVAHTVGPVLNERMDGVRGQLREAQKALRREREKAQELQRRYGKADDPEHEAFLKHRDVVDALFGIKVLDPAMGSGHFLVEAVDFVTDRMLDFLNAFPWNPVVYQLRETRETILRELDEQGVTVDSAKLTDINLLKRYVLKRCIYGVDINPMAVELAKVSLWLDSFTLGAPLSFLDHHLKCGNSLVGVSVDEVRHAIEGKGLETDAHDARSQVSLFGSRFAGLMLATDLMRRVGELSDVTAAQVKESRAEFRRANDQLAPFKRILDVYTSQWFGNGGATNKAKRGRAAEPPAVAFLKSGSAEPFIQHGAAAASFPVGAGPRACPGQPQGVAPTKNVDRTVVETTLAAARDKRFFHWELEFPEVFYGPREGTARVITRAPDAGFDAVIGNPPWIRQETIQADKAALAAQFAGVFDSVADIYIFFLARGLAVLAPSRLLGMIVPNKWHRAAYGEKLRRLLAEHEQPVTLIDFGHAPVFPDADTFPCILVVRNAQPQLNDGQVQVCSVPREILPTLNLPAFVAHSSRSVPTARLNANGWDLESSQVSDLLEKIKRAGVPLREYTGGKPYRGVLTGYNEAFLIDQQTRDRLVAEDPNCEPIIKKFLRGRDIQRWHSQWGGQWMIVLKSSENHAWPWANAGDKAQSVFRKTYLSLYRHMAQHEEPLRKRQDHGRYWWELRSCDYYEQLDGPKIIYQDIAFHSWFALDADGMYSNNTCYFTPGEDLYLLGVLNSSVIWWYLSRSATHAKDEAFRLHGIFMEELPIPKSSRRDAIEGPARQLVDVAADQQQMTTTFFNWLASKLGTTRVTQKLETYWQLDAKTLEAEVRRAGAGALTPAAQRLLAEEHTRQVAQLRPLLAKTRQLEVELQHLVFDLYGLTPEEVQLLRSTAPPRDPLALVEAAGANTGEATDA